ncbi:hypothetical protein WMY93_011544 [Mugilogobius chulae]|uniref:3-dehydroquinate synthase domain-containing protein n=1 Tax=Mugilogobius chulae TaxID=88201 RepID=A0AAW0P900_9GOBI
MVRQREDAPETEGKLSDAKIFEKQSSDGVSWTVVSPIVFTYKITQCENLLDPNNDTLLWGHLDEDHLHDIKPQVVKRFIVIDDTVHQLYGAKVKEYFDSRRVVYKILPLPTTEENKSLELVTQILQEVHDFGLDRRSEPIVAVGGGVCLDVVGLAASLYRRRTPYIRVPTTLLAYVDASVGAKTGTLPQRQLSNGMAEILKMALMKHRGLFELLEAQGSQMLESKLQSSDAASACTTRVAIETMLEELAPNLWEDDLDRLVDFGHLISPQLEMKVLPALLHGEAVNIDMCFMVYVSHLRGLLSAEEKSRVVRCMLGLNLPVWHQDCTLDLIHKALNERLRHSAGSPRMPLPTALGQAEIFHDMIEDDLLSQAHHMWTSELSPVSK